VTGIGNIVMLHRNPAILAILRLVALSMHGQAFEAQDGATDQVVFVAQVANYLFYVHKHWVFGDVSDRAFGLFQYRHCP
jgi:hypothetical protein